MNGKAFLLLLCLAPLPVQAQNGTSTVALSKKNALTSLAVIGVAGVIAYYIYKNQQSNPVTTPVPQHSSAGINPSHVCASPQAPGATAPHNSQPIPLVAQIQNPLIVPSTPIPPQTVVSNSTAVPIPPHTASQTSHRRHKHRSLSNPVLPQSSAIQISASTDQEIMPFHLAQTDLLPIASSQSPVTVSSPARETISQNPTRRRRLNRSLSQPDLARAALAVSNDSDLEVIKKLLNRADVQKDHFLRERFVDLKELIENTQALLDELRADTHEGPQTSKFIEILDILRAQTDDEELSDYIQEQLQILATLHVRIRKHIKKHYRVATDGQKKRVERTPVSTAFSPILHSGTFQ